MYEEPTVHIINDKTGNLSHATGEYHKRIVDLTGVYADDAAFNNLCNLDAQYIVYKVNEVRPKNQCGDLIFGTTYMLPGLVGDEYFMTRGHIHAKANRPETYYGESGTGLMLLESPHGETRILEISAKVLVYVPPMWIHRSVNIGDEPLVMSFCYPSDSGQNYDVIAQSGGMAKRILKDGSGWKAVDNKKYIPRTTSQIDAIFATVTNE